MVALEPKDGQVEPWRLCRLCLLPLLLPWPSPAASPELPRANKLRHGSAPVAGFDESVCSFLLLAGFLNRNRAVLSECISAAGPRGPRRLQFQSWRSQLQTSKHVEEWSGLQHPLLDRTTYLRSFNETQSAVCFDSTLDWVECAWQAVAPGKGSLQARCTSECLPACSWLACRHSYLGFSRQIPSTART